MLGKSFLNQLHRLVFSLRHSKEARDDLDWEEEERGRIARREAAEKIREQPSEKVDTVIATKASYAP